jgi:hypothetical protein
MPKWNSIFKLAASLLLLSAGLSRAQGANAPAIDVYDGFETANLSKVWDTSRFVPGAVEMQTNIFRAGHGAAKITLRARDTFEAGINGSKDTERDELMEAKKLTSKENEAYEFSFSLFLPTNFPIVPTRLVIAQWKQACPAGGNCQDDSPVAAVRYVSGVLKITHQTGPHQTTLFETREELRGQWLDFRFQMRFSTNTNGRIKAWLNDKPVVDYTGVNAYPENATTSYPSPSRFYFKMGLYRDLMAEPMTLYIDEYRKRRLPENELTTSTFPAVNDLPVRKEMPEVMTMNDGTKVTTVEQWRQRREEMKQILEYYELGHAPPPPGNVTGQDIQSRIVLDGAAKFRLVHLKFGPDEKLGFDVAIFTPTNGGPFPTIINPSFFSTPEVNFTNSSVALTNKPGETNEPAVTNSAQARLLAKMPVDPEKAARGFKNPLQRGYAIVTYRYTQCGEDNSNYCNSAFYPAYPGYDWGLLLGWAWGLSRVVDYLETQPFVDTNKLIALGHSRLGKLTMVATAFDERISLGAPAGSSGAGTGAYRFCGPGRSGKEGIEDMTRKYPYYFVPRLKEFTGQMDKLPFDAHWFIALTAPRPWISIEGTDDQNCVPNAVKQSVLAARPVYAFLGASVERVGVNYEPHRHALTADDWTAALDFADQQLRGINVERRFDRFPSEPALTTPEQSSAKTNAVIIQ